MKLPLIKCPTCGKAKIPDRTKIGPTLKAERVSKGVSGLSIANRIGLDKSTLHNMELGRVPDRWTPAVIAEYRKAITALAAIREAKKLPKISAPTTAERRMGMAAMRRKARPGNS